MTVRTISRSEAGNGVAATAVLRPPAAALHRVVDFVSLTKPRIVLMVLVTTAVGYRLGSTGAVDWVRLLQTLLGTALVAAGTLALNQYLERESDGLLRRTQHRALPDGRLAPREALVFGTLMSLIGLGYLAVMVGSLATGLTLATTCLYLFLYTPLKQLTPLATLVGAIPGAMPPLTGWAAARGEFGPGGWVLFAILFLWQVPHTLAIAQLYREDYARAGIRVLPVVDPDGRSTERQIVLGALALWAIALLPTLVGLTGSLYFFGALALDSLFLACAIAHALDPSRASARRVVLASVLLLPLLFALMAFDAIG